jgi:hypothetical protein
MGLRLPSSITTLSAISSQKKTLKLTADSFPHETKGIAYPKLTLF